MPSDAEPSPQQARGSQLARGSGLTFRHCGFCLQKPWSGKASWRRGRGRCCNMNGVYSGNRTAWRGAGRAGEAGAGRRRDRRRGKGGLRALRSPSPGSSHMWLCPSGLLPARPSPLASASCPSLHTPTRWTCEVTTGILITPVKPNPPFVQTSELSQKPLPPGTRPRDRGS